MPQTNLEPVSQFDSAAVTPGNPRRSIVPAPGPLRTLTKATLANTIGNGLYYTVQVIFFTKSVGLSGHEVAIGLGIAAAVGLVVAVPAGHMADRRGPRNLSAVSLVLEGAAMAAFVLVHTFAAFVLVSVVGSLFASSSASLRGALMSRFGVGEERVRTRAYQRSVTNLGMSFGMVFAGVALAVGTRDAYVAMVLANAATFVVSAYFVTKLPGLEPTNVGSSGVREPMWAVLRDRRYLMASGLNGIFWIHFAVQSVGLPLWIIDHTSAPHWWVALLLIMNTTMVILLQVRLSRGSGDLVAAARAFRRSGLLVAVAFLCYGAAEGVNVVVASGLLVIGMALHTFGELYSSGASWGIGFGMAREDLQGQYQGAYSLGRSFSGVLGPLVVITIATSSSRLGWVVLAVTFVVVGAAFPPLVRSYLKAGGEHLGR